MFYLRVFLIALVLAFSAQVPVFADEDTSSGLDAYFTPVTAQSYTATVIIVDPDTTEYLTIAEPTYLGELLAANKYDYRSYLYENNDALDPLTILKNNEQILIILKKYKNNIKTIALDPPAELVESTFVATGEKIVVDPGTKGNAIRTRVVSNDGTIVETTNVIVAPTPKKIVVGTGEATILDADNIEDLESFKLEYPVENPYVTSDYGNRFHPVLKVWKLHDGTDFGASCNTVVSPAGTGTVLSAKYETGYGNRVLIDHGGGFVTGYAHLNEFNVEVGDVVSPGDVLGLVGSTGYSTGCHLHFMVLINGTSIDPMTMLEDE